MVDSEYLCIPAMYFQPGHVQLTDRMLFGHVSAQLHRCDPMVHDSVMNNIAPQFIPSQSWDISKLLSHVAGWQQGLKEFTRAMSVVTPILEVH